MTTDHDKRFKAFLYDDKAYVQAHYPGVQCVKHPNGRNRERFFLIDTGDGCASGSGNASAAWAKVRERMRTRTKRLNAITPAKDWYGHAGVTTSLTHAIDDAAEASLHNAIYDALYVSLLRLRFAHQGILP